MKLKSFEKEIFFATLRISAVNADKTDSSVGTGFLVTHPVPGFENSSVIVLITCKHVLFRGEGHITLHLHRRSRTDPKLPALQDPFEIGPATHRDAYYEHRSPAVDVAGINLSAVFSEDSEVFHKHIRADGFATFQEEDLVPGREAVFVGYPIGIYDTVNNLPILRTGRIATIPTIDFDGRPEFLVDAQVFPGSSGSPVFVPLGGRWRFVGMIGRAFEREIPVELIDVALGPGVKDLVGLGIVYKPDAVREVVDAIALSQSNRSGTSDV